MIDNQLARRNLTDGWRLEYELKKKDILLAIHERERIENREKNSRVSNNDTRESESGKTQKEIASNLGWSTGKVAQGFLPDCIYSYSNNTDTCRPLYLGKSSNFHTCFLSVRN